MPPELQKRIFEPFFTTKEVGKGTGLGLSTVFGIVQEYKGHIHVYSEMGHGTCFKIYLPRCMDGVTVAAQSVTPQAIRRSGTILLVEDETATRLSVAEYLKSIGYEVLHAASGDEAIAALKIYREEKQHGVDLLLTDVVMRGMSGKELATTLQQENPKLKIIFMSGYTQDTVLKHGVQNSEVGFIQKPFSLRILSEHIAEMLQTVPENALPAAKKVQPAYPIAEMQRLQN